MGEVPTLVEFLTRVAGGGLAGVIVAFLLEHVKPFQRLDSEAKKWIVLGIHIALPMAAAAALQFVPSETWATLEPYWRALALGFVAWMGSQAAHVYDKRVREERKLREVQRRLAEATRRGGER